MTKSRGLWVVMITLFSFMVVVMYLILKVDKNTNKSSEAQATSVYKLPDIEEVKNHPEFLNADIDFVELQQLVQEYLITEHFLLAVRKDTPCDLNSPAYLHKYFQNYSSGQPIISNSKELRNYQDCLKTELWRQKTIADREKKIDDLASKIGTLLPLPNVLFTVEIGSSNSWIIEKSYKAYITDSQPESLSYAVLTLENSSGTEKYKRTF